MKKSLKVLLAVFLACSLTACSSAVPAEQEATTEAEQTQNAEKPVDEKAAVSDVVNGYAAAFQNGDLNAVNAFVSADSGLGWDEAEMKAAVDEMDLGYPMEDATREGLETFMYKVIASLAKKVYADTTVEDVQVNGDTATVTMQVKGIPEEWMTEGAGEAIGEELGSDVTEEWLAAHQEEAEDYLASHTEGEFINWLFQNVLPILSENTDQLFADVEQEQTTQTFTVERIDGSWRITSINIQS